MSTSARTAAAEGMEDEILERTVSSRDSRFACNICFDAVSEPVVTLCGHLYCWPCLYRWLEPGMTRQERIQMWGTGQGGTAALQASDPTRRRCPVCKASCSVVGIVPIYVRNADEDDDDVDDTNSTRRLNNGGATNGTSHNRNGKTSVSAARGRETDIHNRSSNVDTTTATMISNMDTRPVVSTPPQRRYTDEDMDDDTTIQPDAPSSDSTERTGLRRRRRVSGMPNTTETNNTTTDGSQSGVVPSRPQPQESLRNISTGMTSHTPNMYDQRMHQQPQQQQYLVHADHHGMTPTAPLVLSPTRTPLAHGLAVSLQQALFGIEIDNRNMAGRGTAASPSAVPPLHNRQQPNNQTPHPHPDQPHQQQQHQQDHYQQDRQQQDRHMQHQQNPGQHHTLGQQLNDGRRLYRYRSSPRSDGMAEMEDLSTEFLSRVLLMLGSFVVLCLLLF